MKFGATLPRRSVPQWRTHNLDYDEIKNLIKQQTSSPDGCTPEFEKNLLALLDSELERVDEFVRCKAGEIERRLSACQRTVKTLSRETGNNGNNSNSSLKQFFKIEAEIDGVSKDAQLLARFVNAQYTGFKKLIKKHAKWCHLSLTTPYSLSSQFVPHLETQRPFHRRVDFQQIMRQLSFLYNARLDPDQKSTVQSQTALDLADRNMDHSMQSSVTYWVHNDNQVETELFLLKHLILQFPSSQLSSKDIRRSTRTAYLDSGDWSMYISLVPESPNQTLQFKVPQILWEENSRNKGVVIVIPEEGEYRYLSMKRKSVANFLSTKELDLESLECSGPSIEQWAETVRKVHKYIHQSSLHPTIQVSTDRTSFVKFSRNKSTTSRVDATMDRNICSTRLPSQTYFLNFDDGEEDLVNLDGYKSVFPHSVLQIRWDGDSPRWLEELNGSHLVERINGFSMYANAVATLLPSSIPKQPYWIPLLQKDIRKLQPPSPQTVRKRDSGSPFVTTDSKTSSSQEARPSTVTAPTTQSITRPKKTRLSDTASGYGSAPSSPVVYWSELENTEEEPYTVPVDESTVLLPWLVRRRKERDLERQHESGKESFLKRTFGKIREAVEFEVKTSTNGLSTLFYEKDAGGELSDEEEDYNSEDSSDSPAVVAPEQSRQRTVDHNSNANEEGISRTELLNRGYSLCVIGCTMLLCLFASIGLSLDGSATGMAFVLVGSLVAITLEIVSLVRFIMQGGHSGVAWIGFLVVALAGGVFVPLVAMTEEA